MTSPLTSTLKIGDVLAVRTAGFFSTLIRIDAALQDEPNVSNHVAIVHHFDPQGRPWVIAGQPGGVGYTDARTLATEKWTLNNCGQPGRTDEQRKWVAKAAEKMLGTPYDWEAIADDALRTFAPHIKALWNHDWHGVAPGHVVCSSFAAYLYKTVGWDYPKEADAREIEPADWDKFIMAHGYSVNLRS